MLVKFEQNRTVQTTPKCELFDKKKSGFFKTIDFKTITFQCFKNYGIVQYVTSLKVAPNMADETRLVLQTQTVALKI